LLRRASRQSITEPIISIFEYNQALHSSGTGRDDKRQYRKPRNSAALRYTPGFWADIIAGMRCCTTLLLFSWAVFGQSSPTGNWISNLTFFDQQNYDHLQLELSGAKLTGKLGDAPFDGTFQNGRIEGTVKPNPRTTIQLQGSVRGDRIDGTGTVLEQKIELKWEAAREPAKGTAARTHTFEPTQFHHFFSDAIEPALHINPGDTVRTWSVDAGGTDPKGVRRTSGGNPLTGPFYVEGAIPGDTLLVHFTRIRLNRDSAISSPLIASSALNPGYVEQRKPVEGYNSDWKLDLQGGFARWQSQPRP
jgi:hypothetical protein